MVIHVMHGETRLRERKHKVEEDGEGEMRRGCVRLGVNTERYNGNNTEQGGVSGIGRGDEGVGVRVEGVSEGRSTLERVDGIVERVRRFSERRVRNRLWWWLKGREGGREGANIQDPRHTSMR